MQKLIVDGEKFEFDENDGVKLLSEEELKCAHGGIFFKEGTMLYRWHCEAEGCGATGDWSTNYDESIWDGYSHYQLTGHGKFQHETKIL